MKTIKPRSSGRDARLYVSAALTFVVFAAIGLVGCAEKQEDNVSKSAASPASAANVKAEKINVKTVTASNSGSPATNVNDGDIKTPWSAAGPAPQWIQLDFGEESSVSKVRLNVSQTPPGLTTHEVYGGPTPDQLKLLGTLEGTTQDSQWIELSVSATNVRYLKIATVKSPSWIAWREIEVFK
jgi:hypothetical protein